MFTRILALAVWSCLLWSPALRAQTLLVPPGATWKYLDDGSNQGTAWRATNFNDTAWASGPAELGCGDAAEGRPEKTVVSYGANTSAKPITTYFRHTFVATPAGFTNLPSSLLRPGTNVLAVEVHQVNGSSSDPEL